MSQHNVCRNDYHDFSNYELSVENAHLAPNNINTLNIPANFEVMEVDEECSKLMSEILGEEGLTLNILDVSAENMGGEWDGRACPLVDYGFRTLGSMTKKDLVAAPKNSAPAVIENILHFIEIGIMQPDNIPRILLYEPLEGKLMVESVAKSIQEQAFSIIDVKTEKDDNEFESEFEISSSKIVKKEKEKLTVINTVPNTTTKKLKRIVEFINVPAFQKIQNMLKEKFQVEAFLGSNPDIIEFLNNKGDMTDLLKKIYGVETNYGFQCKTTQECFEAAENVEKYLQNKFKKLGYPEVVSKLLSANNVLPKESRAASGGGIHWITKPSKRYIYQTLNKEEALQSKKSLESNLRELLNRKGKNFYNLRRIKEQLRRSNKECVTVKEYKLNNGERRWVTMLDTAFHEIAYEELKEKKANALNAITQKAFKSGVLVEELVDPIQTQTGFVVKVEYNPNSGNTEPTIQITPLAHSEQKETRDGKHLGNVGPGHLSHPNMYKSIQALAQIAVKEHLTVNPNMPISISFGVDFLNHIPSDFNFRKTGSEHLSGILRKIGIDFNNMQDLVLVDKQKNTMYATDIDNNFRIPYGMSRKEIENELRKIHLLFHGKTNRTGGLIANIATSTQPLADNPYAAKVQMGFVKEFELTSNFDKEFMQTQVNQLTQFAQQHFQNLIDKKQNMHSSLAS